MTEPTASLSNVSKSYGRQLAVDDVSLELRADEVLGFIGPNGAGKTTVVRMLLGLVQPTKGEVRILGERVSRFNRSVLTRVGSLVERPAFYRHLSGADNLRVLGPLSGSSGKAEIRRVLGLIGLDAVGGKRVGRYSQGMVQRLAIGLALLGDPDVLLLDEPTNSLDPSGIHWMRGLISQLARSGKAVFLTSHHLTEVERVCTRVAIINRGRILRTGPLATVLPRQEQLLLIVDDAVAACRAIAEESWAAGARTEGPAIVVAGGANIAEVARRRLDELGYPLLRIEKRLATHEECFAALTAEAG